MGTHSKTHSARRDSFERVDRKFIKCDIENLAGGPLQPVEEYARVMRILLRDSIRVRPGDLVVVASSRFVAKRIMPALAGFPLQWRWQDGPDGADHALLDFSDLAHEARRRSTFVIASGDGIFTEQTERARELGMSTHQIIGHGRPSRRLWNACQTHTTMRLGAPAASGMATVTPEAVAA